MELSPGEADYYSRQLLLPELGEEGQRKLRAASVLVVGVGGLGTPTLQYLAAAGVGTLGLVDYDRVEASNLHRQVLFGASDIGRSKVSVARERLEEANPHISVQTHKSRLTKDNALEIMGEFDLVLDCTDNFPARYLVNDASVLLNIPNIYGALYRFEGQLSVFNLADADGNRGPNYRDLYPDPPARGTVPNCAEIGVLGVLPGMIGCMQACEAIKVIAGIGEPLSGRLFLFDARTFHARTVKVAGKEDNPLTGENPVLSELIDYEAFCGGSRADREGEERKNVDIPEVTARGYRSWLDRGEKIQLVDVREPWEARVSGIGGVLIPLGSIAEQVHKIDRDKKVVVYCRSGRRSSDAVRRLRDKHGFENLYNLRGGLLAYQSYLDG